ncbi:xanthine dehydrogenase family protein molybdopterin-binding subunit [Candidatus Poriferisocius sp.]|uniref:xanthine dehydrogenase family protein molybdopterin-binding subunit n=1 Tax=Candidatus Poriferisocius sp. TaxID=3101276 RepID=UPI003B026A54
MTLSDTWVGRSIRRVEDPALVRGDGRYVGDVAVGMATARFVRSASPTGLIRSIDGPCCTAADLDAAGVGEIEAVLHRPDFVKVSQPLLARDRVRYVGEPVAVVVGRSPEEAEDLAEQVIVEIDPDDEPLVHPFEATTNTVVEGQFATPEIDDALDQADCLVEMVLTSHRQAALPLETRGATAAYDRRTGRLTVHASTQAPHILRTAVSDLLCIPEADVQVVAPDVGGGFGQKLPLAREDVVVAWLALQRRGSVAWIEDRSENLTSSWHSRDQVYRVKGGFAFEGELLAIDAEVACDVGAWSCYPVTWGVEPLMAMGELCGPYTVAHYRVRSRGVSSHRCPVAPYRGVSRPVITAALERLMDTAARRLKMDPVEIRRRNLVTEFPHTSVTGVVHDAGTYAESLDAAVEHFDLDEFRDRQEKARKGGGPLLGVGISTFAERTGYGTPVFATRSMGVTIGYETVTMNMDPSGFVEACIGASPHGQGLETTLAQVIADELAVDVLHIRIIHGDTDRTPYGWGTFASRSMVIAGGAVQIAAGRLRERLAQVAAAVLEANSDDIVFNAGRASVAGTDVGVPISELARIAHHHTERLEPGTPAGLAVEASYDPGGTFSNACHIAEVEIDPETGATTVTRFVVVEDAGRLINPMIVDGQIRGGVAQGIANALYEEVVYDEDGNILTASLMDYLPPTAAEIPDIEIRHLETITDATITGAKGLGEGGTIGAPAAILNAVSDALAHLDLAVDELPATPDRVRALIRSREDTR